MLSPNIVGTTKELKNLLSYQQRKIGRTRELKILVRSTFIGSDCCYEPQRMNAENCFTLRQRYHRDHGGVQIEDKMASTIVWMRACTMDGQRTK